MSFHQKQKMYLAAPLFSDMERNFNQALACSLGQFFDVFLPQSDGGLMVDMIGKGVHPSEAGRRVFRIDIEALNKSDVLLILLDGRTVDEGAAFELGYAFALGKICIGLQTDVRRLLRTGNNPMIDGGLHHVFQGMHGLLTWATEFTGDSAVRDCQQNCTDRNRLSMTYEPTN